MSAPQKKINVALCMSPLISVPQLTNQVPLHLSHMLFYVAGHINSYLK